MDSSTVIERVPTYGNRASFNYNLLTKQHLMNNAFILKQYFGACYSTYIDVIEPTVSDELPANHPSYLLAQGLNYLKNGEIVPAMELMTKSAESGNGFAAYSLGVCHIYAADAKNTESYEGMLIDGVEWLTYAAELGEDEAMVALGFFYLAEDCPYRSAEKSAMWFGRAAEAGNAEGMYEYGCCYSEGRGVEQDYLQSAAWLQKSADCDFTLAQFELAVQYSLGEGVARDDKKALELYRKAADKGHPGAMAGLASCYYNGDGVEIDYGEAYMLFYRSYAAGNPKGNVGLAHFYIDSKAMACDYQTALKLLTAEAAKEYEPAQQMRESLLQQLKEQALQLCPYALTQLGWATLNGVAYGGNKENAYELLSAAAEMDDPLARCLLRCYLNEFDAPNAASIEECRDFFRDQMEYGLHWGARELMLMAMRGDFEATDDEISELYTKALELWDFETRDAYFLQKEEVGDSED